MSTFVMLKRGELLNDLLEDHPNAFLLLTLIAVRARRTPNLIKNLDICECQLGDYKACGLTEQKYRTAKSILEKLNLATFESTNKGTIGRLINTDIYNINPESCNGQTNEQATDKQRTDNEQATTNNNVNKENKEKNVIKVHPFETHLQLKITENNLFNFVDKIIEFYKYRMAMKKKDQYQTEKGVNGLIRNVLELKTAGLDVNDSLEYAMEKNWKSPELKYFNNQKQVQKNKNSFDSFVDEAFEENRRR